MIHAEQMLQTNPSSAAVDAPTLVECIEACFDCAQACTSCADACLGEQEPGHLTACIRLNLDCADLCETTGRIVTRQTASDDGVVRAAVEACVVTCSACRKACSACPCTPT